MRVLSVNYPKRRVDHLKVENFCKFYEEDMKDADKEISDQIKLEDVSIMARPKPGCCKQFKIICKRNGTSCRRNPIVFKARLGQNIVLGLFSALIFNGCGT